MAKQWLMLGAISGFFGVVFGAFGGHVLKTTLEEKWFSIFKIGIQYQLWHTLALIAVGLWAQHNPNADTQIPGLAFTFGIVLFSGSLYALALTRLPFLGAITPLGGVSFLVGWASFGYLIFKS